MFNDIILGRGTIACVWNLFILDSSGSDNMTETGKPVNLRFIQGLNHFVGVS